jgi:hypothetical protein
MNLFLSKLAALFIMIDAYAIDKSTIGVLDWVYRESRCSRVSRAWTFF